MDANQWKLFVDKVLAKTKSRDLLWSKTDEGPAKALSFGTSIDDITTLNIWGHETNYSYELHLTKQTGGEPFERLKRVTTKKSAEGIDFSGLFKAAQMQIANITREKALNALLEYLSDPTTIDSDPEKEAELQDRLNAMGQRYFLWSQDEKVLALVRDLTVAGSIPWEPTVYSGDDTQYFCADIGRLGPYLTFSRSLNKDTGKWDYLFDIANEGSFGVTVEIESNKRVPQPVRLLADEIYSIVSKKVRDEKAEFEKIVQDDIVHDILASLDELGK